MFGAILLGIVVAEAVERNHHHVGLGLLRGGVRPVVDGNDRRKVLGGKTKRQEKGRQASSPESTHGHRFTQPAARSRSAAVSGVMSLCGMPNISKPTMNLRTVAERSNGG